MVVRPEEGSECRYLYLCLWLLVILVPTFSSSTLHKKGHKKIIEHPKVSGAVETKEAKKETTVKRYFI